MAAGRPRTFDTEKALEEAMRLFWAKGYEGTSITDLTEVMGISRPSLYAAFGDKEALFGKVLERYGSGPASFFEAALAAGSARDVAAQLLKGAASALTDPAYPAGCLAVQSALVAGDDGVKICQDLQRLRADNQASLEARMRRAIDDGDLPADADAALIARYLATIFQGMAVQAAGGASRADLERVADLALKGWPPV